MEGTVRQYIAEHQQELLELTLQLCQIPAPTGKEDARAAFCRDWLCRSGAGNVTIDRAKNVICTIGRDARASGGGFSGASGYRFSGISRRLRPGLRVRACIAPGPLTIRPMWRRC